MDVAKNAKTLTLDAQYIARGNIMAIRIRFLDLAKYQYAFMCQAKSHPDRLHQEDEFNHLLLIDHIWGECGEMEFIDLKGSQTGVRFYLPRSVELSEIDEYENAIRKNFSRPRIGLWLWDNLGWTPKVIELFAEELYEHRVTSLQHIQGLAIEKLGLGTYPLSYFQTQPASQIGISQTQPDSPQPQVGISQIQPDNPQQPVGNSQLHLDSPRPWAGLFEKPADTTQTQVGEGWDIPKEHPVKQTDVSFTREDQELLRLWADGLTAKEIGMRTGKTGKTVTNRLSVLRGMYGEERIPLRKAPTRKDLG
jgi:hypothetical protein